MKNLKKIIVAASLCAAIGATAIAGTLAYFTDTTDTKTNVFTVGDLDITLDEPNWDYDDSSFEIIPGNSVDKDPVVTVEANSVDSYLRVVVTMPTDLYQMSDFYGSTAASPYVTFDSKSADWTVVSATADLAEPSKTTVILDYNAVISSSAEDQAFVLFTKMNFSSDLTNNAENDANGYDAFTKLQALADEDLLKIDVTAYATQAEGFETSAEAFASSFDIFGE